MIAAVAGTFDTKSEELSYMMSNAEAKLVFMGSRYTEMVDKMLPDLSSVKECITIDEKVEGKLFLKS